MDEDFKKQAPYLGGGSLAPYQVKEYRYTPTIVFRLRRLLFYLVSLIFSAYILFEYFGASLQVKFEADTPCESMTNSKSA